MIWWRDRKIVTSRNGMCEGEDEDEERYWDHIVWHSSTVQKDRLKGRLTKFALSAGSTVSL